MSFLGSAGSGRRAGAGLLRHRVISATAGTAAALIVAGCAFASTHSSGQEKLVNTGNSKVSKVSKVSQASRYRSRQRRRPGHADVLHRPVALVAAAHAVPEDRRKLEDRG